MGLKHNYELKNNKEPSKDKSTVEKIHEVKVAAEMKKEEIQKQQNFQELINEYLGKDVKGEGDELACTAVANMNELYTYLKDRINAEGMDELYYNKMSEEFVETLEDVVAYKIALSDLIRLFQTNIELANWGRIIHQDEHRRLHRSHKERLTLSAKERYEEFRQQFPQVNQRAQLGYIASYLGITLSTLSRLRGARK